MIDYKIGVNYHGCCIRYHACRDPIMEARRGRAVIKQLQDTVADIQSPIGERTFGHAARYYG